MEREGDRRWQSQRGVPPRRFPKAPRTQSWAAGSAWPCWRGRLDPEPSGGPVPPRPFCDAVTQRFLGAHFSLAVVHGHVAVAGVVPRPWVPLPSRVPVVPPADGLRGSPGAACLRAPQLRLADPPALPGTPGRPHHRAPTVLPLDPGVEGTHPPAHTPLTWVYWVLPHGAPSCSLGPGLTGDPQTPPLPRELAGRGKGQGEGSGSWATGEVSA